MRLVARVDGKLIEPKIWNSTGAPRIWSIAIDERKRIYVALPDIGQVVRIDRRARRTSSTARWRLACHGSGDVRRFCLSARKQRLDQLWSARASDPRFREGGVTGPDRDLRSSQEANKAKKCKYLARKSHRQFDMRCHHILFFDGASHYFYWPRIGQLASRTKLSM